MSGAVLQQPGASFRILWRRRPSYKAAPSEPFDYDNEDQLAANHRGAAERARAFRREAVPTPIHIPQQRPIAFATIAIAN